MEKLNSTFSSSGLRWNFSSLTMTLTARRMTVVLVVGKNETCSSSSSSTNRGENSLEHNGKRGANLFRDGVNFHHFWLDPAKPLRIYRPKTFYSKYQRITLPFSWSNSQREEDEFSIKARIKNVALPWHHNIKFSFWLLSFCILKLLYSYIYGKAERIPRKSFNQSNVTNPPQHI